MTFALSLTCIRHLVLFQGFAVIAPNTPIHYNRNLTYLLQIRQVTWKKAEPLFFNHEGKAARIEFPDSRMIIVTRQAHVEVLNSFGKGGLAATNSGACVWYIFFVATFGNASYHVCIILVFSDTLHYSVSITADSDEHIVSVRKNVWTLDG
jgi:hypothetical protein